MSRQTTRHLVGHGIPRDVLKDRDLLIAFLAVRRYAETHPRPAEVTQMQAAQMLGVSSRTVRRYILAGLMKRNSRGLLPIEAVDAMRAPIKND